MRRRSDTPSTSERNRGQRNPPLHGLELRFISPTLSNVRKTQGKQEPPTVWEAVTRVCPSVARSFGQYVGPASGVGRFLAG